MGGMSNAYDVFGWKTERKRGVNGRITLEWILGK
jgi:hypothetical protein